MREKTLTTTKDNRQRTKKKKKKVLKDFKDNSKIFKEDIIEIKDSRRENVKTYKKKNCIVDIRTKYPYFIRGSRNFYNYLPTQKKGGQKKKDVPEAKRFDNRDYSRRGPEKTIQSVSGVCEGRSLLELETPYDPFLLVSRVVRHMFEY